MIGACLTADLYDRLAPYYDVINASQTADLAMYLALAQEAAGAVLVLGCGSGRVVAPLAQAGREVVGLDNSAAMLDRAQQRLNFLSLHAELIAGDMTDFDLGRQFGLILVPFNAWMHLTDHQSQDSALRCIAAHLTPGGRLIIDIPAPATIVEADHDRALTLEGIFDLPETAETLLQFASTDLDAERQCLHVTWIYDRVSQTGALHRTVVPMKLKYVFPTQVEPLLCQAGLRLGHLWGDYRRTPHTPGAERLVIVGIKTVT
jgi:SAM-dependent methyltransferase